MFENWRNVQAGCRPARKLNVKWRKKIRRLGVLTFFKQGLGYILQLYVQVHKIKINICEPYLEIVRISTNLYKAIFPI